jgi:hypothetical protein
MNDLGCVWEPAGKLFVEDFGPVDRHLKAAAVRRNEREIVDLVRVPFQKRRRQTGGAREVISGHAVDYLKFHGHFLPMTARRWRLNRSEKLAGCDATVRHTVQRATIVQT